MLPLDPFTLATTDDPHTNANQRGQESAAGHLEQRAQRLAAQHADMAEAGTGGQQFDSLPKLGTRLGAMYNVNARLSADEANTVYATEWVLDNHYLLDQTRQEIEGDLPLGYYRQLPKLAGVGPGCGYPRTFALARAYVINDECQFDGRRFARFVTAYQQHQPLTMGEIWALPIMLRYAFLASVVQAGERITGIVSGSAEADDSFDVVWDLAHLVNDNEASPTAFPACA